MKTSYPHIPLSAVPRIENFQYKGEDRSYLYAYFFSPLADRLAQIMPMWLAPNVITFSGFILNFISHALLLWYQGMGMEGFIPGWLILLTGV